MNTSVISINQLTRHFKETVARDNLSLEVHSGGIFGFLGHNGVVKTTTVRLLNGVINPTSGSMCVLGLDPQVDGPAFHAYTGKFDIGLVRYVSFSTRPSACDWSQLCLQRSAMNS